MSCYVYVLKCVDDKIYIGCTNDLRDRLTRHSKGYCFYTKSRLPVKLLFYCCFPDKYLAYDFEGYLKSGSGKAFLKKHLIKK